ncbi:mate efflux family protein [Fulvivirga imtechensis AK7]|uniref:Mate efflux family protein n=1 Tax=Fulvivirga imtechensis AK7 TaxID=1237149 RepID=L8JKF9_9BACT|nr:MATE family efflux transporter [Fulvivirga imtechensis]ELR69406.1 mate efflux family protein [Fulvivirga imtechensis AK7]
MAGRPDLLNDNLWRIAMRLSPPGILGMLMISINSLIDSIYLGNLVGADAFAGVSLLFPLTLVISAATGLIAAGSGSVLSRAIGAGNVEVQRKVIPNLLALALIFSVVLMAAGLLFTDGLVALMGGQGEVLETGRTYFGAYVYSIFFSIYGLSANGLIRAEGKVKEAMNYTMISVVLNLLTTPLFITVFSMGVAGAAWSSVLSMGIYSLLTSWYFIGGRSSFNTGRFGIRIERAIIKDVISVGTSSLSMQLSNVVRQFFLFRLVAAYGTNHDIAFFGAAFRLFTFVSVPAMGLLQPLQPVIGINFGAGKWQRCGDTIKIFRLGAIGLTLLLLAPIIIFPEAVVSIMIPGEKLLEGELHNLRLIFLAMPWLPIASTGIIFFQATGKGWLAITMPVARQLILFVPLVLLLSLKAGIDGIYYALAIENMAYAIVVQLLLRKELKKLSPMTGLSAG